MTYAPNTEPRRPSTSYTGPTGIEPKRKERVVKAFVVAVLVILVLLVLLGILNFAYCSQYFFRPLIEAPLWCVASR